VCQAKTAIYPTPPPACCAPSDANYNWYCAMRVKAYPEQREYSMLREGVKQQTNCDLPRPRFPAPLASCVPDGA